MAKKKKPSAQEMHRRIQDSLQILPHAIEKEEKEGKRGKAVLMRYVGGPLLRLMNRILNRQRYRGTEGTKRRQTEQARRLLEQKRQVIQHVQKNTPKVRKSR